MRRILSRTTKENADGSVETVTELEGGVRITSFSVELPDTPRHARPRLLPGSAGLRRAIRVIDSQVVSGVITAAEAVQREEDLITKFDREGW